MIKYSLCLLALLAMSCNHSNSDNYIPKPKGFPRFDLPVATYTPLPPTYPYQFEYNKAARILPDTFARSEPYWIFISYPAWHASVQLTYKPIQNDPKRLKAMLDDAYKLVAKHNVKADAIEERQLKLPSGLMANVVELSGEVPSQLQFITTDTTKHFLRGALYFNTATENDSLAPVITYIKQDVLHLLQTLKWRDKK